METMKLSVSIELKSGDVYTADTEIPDEEEYLVYLDPVPIKFENLKKKHEFYTKRIKSEEYFEEQVRRVGENLQNYMSRLKNAGS